MIVVIDTCTLVAGALNNGYENKILQLVKNRKISIVYSEDLLTEYNLAPANIIINLLKRGKQISLKQMKSSSHNLAKMISMFVCRFADKVDVKTKVDYIKSDRADNELIDLAIDSNAQYIISNNVDVFEDIPEIRNKNGDVIKIIGPYEFYNYDYKLSMWSRSRVK